MALRPLIPASVDAVGKGIDTPGSAGDAVWQSERCSPLTLDRPLQVGEAGGHGPIRYRVESYEPGRRVRFLLPEEFVGTHGFDVEEALPEDTLEKVEGAFRDAGPSRTWPRRRAIDSEEGGGDGSS